MPDWLRPELLALIPLVLIAWWWAGRHPSRRDDWQRIMPAAFIAALARGPSPARPGRRWLPRLQHPWWLLCGILLSLAAAGPSFRDQPAPALAAEDNLVILLDLSFSMWANDQQPSRIQRARQKISEALLRRTEGSTGIVAYAGSSHVVAPLTPDRATLENLLPVLDPGIMPSPGSRPDLALADAATLLANSPSGSGRILWLTDEVPASLLPNVREWLDRQPFGVSLLALGTRSGGPIPVPERGFLRAGGEVVIASTDLDGLAALMDRPGDRFAALSLDDRDLDTLLLAPATLAFAESQQQLRHPEDAGYWLLFPAALCALMAMRSGLLACLVLVSLLALPGLSPPLRAEESAWLRDDQEAFQQFRNGAFDTAARQFDSPLWQSAARFRLGQHEEAAALLESIDEPLAHYNRGNALAAAGDYPGALQAWEAALALQPDHAQAQENRRRILEWLQQQQQAQGQSGNTGERREDEQSAEGDNGGTDSDASQQQEQADAESQGQGGEEQARQQDTPGRDESEDDSAAMDLSEQQTEQWLRRVPDDPGGPLRRKFILQYRDEPPEDLPGVPLW